MTKNIIFPVNNKGGVGKTSVLTDLCAALAQRYRVGVIDCDDQANLAGTLLKQDLACRSLDGYDLQTHDVVLNEPTQFVFSDALRKLTLDVQATTAQVTVFPTGLLYEQPQKKTELERILNTDMKDASFIAVDLPPIPHPGMILDYTVMPMIQALENNGDDVRLFPLIVTTADHNVLDVALRGYSKIADYFEKKGVGADRIHPFLVINKVPFEIDADGKKTSQFNLDMARKLQAMGVLHLNSWAQATVNLVKRKGTYEGKRFRSVVFPQFSQVHSEDTISSGVRDGQFSLLYGKQTQLHLYPHLAQLVQSYHFPVKGKLSAGESVYLYSLHEMVSYLAAKSGEKPQSNYVKRNAIFNSQIVTSAITTDLRRACEQELSGQEVTYTPNVIKSGASSTYHKHFDIPKMLTVEQVADVLYATQCELNPTVRPSKEDILNELSTLRYGIGEAVKMYDNEGEEVATVSYHCFPQNQIQIAIPTYDCRSEKRTSPEILLPKFDIFLRHLGYAQSRK